MARPSMQREKFVTAFRFNFPGVSAEDVERKANELYGERAVLSGAAAVTAKKLTGDGMNKTERRRAVELDALQRAGEIRSWAFEDVTLRLAHRMRLTPDFFIQHNDRSIEFEEIKGGFIREDSWIKCKMAARLYPMFRWTLRQWKDGRWHVKEIPALIPSRVGTALDPSTPEDG